MSSLPAPAADVMGPFSQLVLPTLVDSTLHSGPVIVRDPPNEKYLDIVFNRDKLRVVDPRVVRNVLVSSRHLHADWLESQLGLIWQL